MATALYSVRQALDDALPDRLNSAANQYDIGSCLRLIKATISGLTAAASFDITSIAAAKITINQGPAPVRASGVLPPIAQVLTLRVTAGGTAGPRAVTDGAGTAGAPGANGPGIATLSDDGKTIGFDGAATTAFIVEYYMRPACSLVANKWVAADMDAVGLAGSDGMGA